MSSPTNQLSGFALPELRRVFNQVKKFVKLEEEDDDGAVINFQDSIDTRLAQLPSGRELITAPNKKMKKKKRHRKDVCTSHNNFPHQNQVLEDSLEDLSLDD